jgi:hypothetical protein
MLAVLLTFWSLFGAVSLRVETPDPRVGQRLVAAQSSLERDLTCITPSSCDDLALNLLALTASGRPDVVRAALGRVPHASPLWALAHYHYWLASGDASLMRERWSSLATSPFASPAGRTISDPGLVLAATDAVTVMARALDDSAAVRRMNGAYDLINQQAQRDGGLIGAAFGAIDADRARDLVDFVADTVHSAFPLATGLVSVALYEQHRGAAAFELMKRMTAQPAGSGAMYVLPFVRGLLGWQADAPNHAFAVTPHLPADWTRMSASGLVIGGDTISVTLSRVPGNYSIELRRTRPHPVLNVQVAPALPSGARVRNVTVNGHDMAIQTDVTLHDVHVPVELAFRREAVIDIEYEMPPRRSPR